MLIKNTSYYWSNFYSSTHLEVITESNITCYACTDKNIPLTFCNTLYLHEDTYMCEVNNIIGENACVVNILKSDLYSESYYKNYVE